MKKIFLILLFASQLFAQSPLLTIMGDDFAYDTDVKTYLTVATTLSKTQALRIDALVKSLKDSLGITALSDVFDVIYILANEDSVSSKLNLVKRAHDAIALNSSEGSFIQWQGWTGGGTRYINTLFNPSTQGVNYTLNSSSYGVYSRTDVSNASYCEIGDYSGTNTRARLYIRGAGDVATYSIQDVIADYNASVTDSRGMFVVTRTASNLKAIYRNGVSIGTDANASGGVPNNNYYFLAWNNNGTAGGYSPRQLSFVFLGKGLTPTQVRQITNCFEVYMDALGTGVIP